MEYETILLPRNVHSVLSWVGLIHKSVPLPDHHCPVSSIVKILWLSLTKATMVDNRNPLLPN